MALESMTCPSCGATVEFSSGTATTVCKFCHSALRLAPQVVTPSSPPRGAVDVDRIKQLLRQGQREQALRLYMDQSGADLEVAEAAINSFTPTAGPSLIGRPASPYALDLDRIKALVDAGNKIQAIKEVRYQTHLGLKEAKDAVEAIACGELPNITSTQRYPVSPVSRGLFERLGCLGVVLPILAIMAACAGCMGLSGQVMFRAWGPYDQALSLVRDSAEVKDALGAPLNTGLFMFGGIESDDRSSDANFETPIFGSKRSGSLRVSGSWDKKNGWDLSVGGLYDQDGEEQTIYLSGKQK
jgi:hypothetical protein